MSRAQIRVGDTHHVEPLVRLVKVVALKEILENFAVDIRLDEQVVTAHEGIGQANVKGFGVLGSLVETTGVRKARQHAVIAVAQPTVAGDDHHVAPIVGETAPGSQIAHSPTDGHCCRIGDRLRRRHDVTDDQVGIRRQLDFERLGYLIIGLTQNLQDLLVGITHDQDEELPGVLDWHRKRRGRRTPLARGHRFFESVAADQQVFAR